MKFKKPKKTVYVTWKSWLLMYDGKNVTKTRIVLVDTTTLDKDALWLVNKQWMDSIKCHMIEEMAGTDIHNNSIGPIDDITKYYKLVLLDYKNRITPTLKY